MVTFEVKGDGHIWGLEFKRYVCFLFRGNQGHDENRPKSNQVIYRSGPTIVLKMKEIQKVVQKLLRGQKFAARAAAAAYEPVKNIVTPGIPGWLNY